MTFGHPQLLACLIILPVTALFLLWAAKHRNRIIARLGDSKLIAKLSDAVNRRGRRWQTGLWLAALGLMTFSLARPQWGTIVEMVEQQGVEIMVVLDISESMLAEDLKPNRLSRAKLEIVDIMKQLGSDELGLVLFSGASFIQFPLTNDFATARSYLDSAQPGVISRPGTAIGDAIRTAMRGFNTERASQKVIIILTDGEDHETDPVAVAQEAAEAGIIIYTIGLGSLTGEPIPEFNDQGVVIGFKKDAQRQTVLSKLDEATLQKIALTANGQYYRASANGREVEALTGEISKLQKSELESRFETRRVERFQGFLLAAIIAAVAIEFIPDKRKIN